MFKRQKIAAVILTASMVFSFMGFDTLAASSRGWNQNDDQEWYYVDTNGDLVTGWQDISGKRYYFNDDGIMQTDWQNIEGKWYYFNANGTMQTGWQKLSGKWYYFDADGAMLKGWQKISNKWYYFDASGVMKTGWQKISGKYYYFNNSGTMLTGWQQISGKWYFFNTSGAMQTGWLNRSGKWYYLNASGAMQTGSQQVSGKWYIFDDSGVMLTGLQEVDGKVYYYDEVGGAMQTGLIWIGEDLYYFNSSMQKGWKSVDGNYYYFTDDGVAVVGDFFEQSGKTYYFNDQGVMQTGLVVIGDDTYYFRESGAMVINDTVDGMEFGPDGKRIISGEDVTVDNAKWYYLNTTTGYDCTTRLDLDLTLSDTANVYYSVAKDGEVVYTSEVINTDYLAMTYSSVLGAETTSDGYIVEGTYTFTAYFANGAVLYTDDAAVTTVGGGTVSPDYSVYINWNEKEDNRSDYYNIYGFYNGYYGNYFDELGTTRYEFIKDGTVVYQSDWVEPDDYNEVEMDSDSINELITDPDTGLVLPGVYTVKVYSEDNELIGSESTTVYIEPGHINVYVNFYEDDETGLWTISYEPIISYPESDTPDTMYVLSKDNQVFYESAVVAGDGDSAREFTLDSRFTDVWDTEHDCLIGGKYTVTILDVEGNVLATQSRHIEGYLEPFVIESDEDVAWDAYFMNSDFERNKYYSDCDGITFCCYSPVEGLQADLYRCPDDEPLNLRSVPYMTVAGEATYEHDNGEIIINEYEFRFESDEASFIPATYYVVVRDSSTVIMIAKCYVTNTKNPYSGAEIFPFAEDRLNVFSWNEELANLLQRYSDVEFGYEMVESYAYQAALDARFAVQDSSTPDLFACDADYGRKYINSSFTASLEDLGIGDDELEDMYQYTIDYATTNNGDIKGLTWQAHPSVVFYNRTIAQRFLGVSDPSSVSEYFANWNSVISTARQINDASNGTVKIASGIDDFTRAYVAGANGWVTASGSIDPTLGEYLDFAKLLNDEDLTWNTWQWSNDWNNNALNGSTLAYFGPMWLGQFVLGINPEYNSSYDSDVLGTWGICPAPTGSFWGGTWLMANKYSSKLDLAAQAMRDLCINIDNLEDMAERGEFVNNRTVNGTMAIVANDGFDWLGGQNPYAMLDHAAASARYSPILDNNAVYNEFSTVENAYLDGEFDSLAEAEAAFLARYHNLVG